MNIIDAFNGNYRFLSNFWYSEILYKGISYPSVEHAYQASKTNSLENKLYIASLKTPVEAKKAGKKLDIICGFDNQKISIMKELCKLKFQDKSLALKLKLTDPAKLIEGNSWGDTFWGVCNGKGENNLGIILMDIRRGILNND